MARHFVLGNGKFLVCLDKNAQIRDFYFPYVGQENHVNGKIHKFGIWVDDQFTDFYSDLWEKKLSYKKETLVTDVFAVNKKLKIELSINDIVHHKKDIFLRKICVKNNSNKNREVKLFLHQIFQISGDNIGNTVYYNPLLKAIIFYKGKRYFLVNGLIYNSESHGISSYTTGIFEERGFESTYVDAKDGKLSNNPIEHGSVDSTVSFKLDLSANQTEIVYYWICAGKKNTTITRLNEFVLKQGPEFLIDQTDTYWKNWVNKHKFNFGQLSENIIDLFKRSLLIVNAHVDRGGAFIASSDSETLHLKKDTYSYMWPRDGALIARSLDRAGYKNITESFFQFCCKALTKEGYLFHKYNPDGSLGSSWHPWIHEGHFQLPIQEDQIALVLDALWKHYSEYKNDEYIKSLFDCFIKRSSQFLFNFMDKEIGLPKESYDVWEEKLGIHTFTCATVYAGFSAAANFEKIFGSEQEADKYQKAADQLKENICKYLYDDKKGMFIKGLYREKDELKKDLSVDASSSYGVFEFKVLSVDDDRLKKSFDVFKEKLLCNGPVGGYARHENDEYYKINPKTPGNPWFITGLWLAEYYIALAKSKEELKPALKIFDWVYKYKLETGILSEQLNPNTGAPCSVAPLTWSHAAFIIAVDKYLEKIELQ